MFAPRGGRGVSAVSYQKLFDLCVCVFRLSCKPERCGGFQVRHVRNGGSKAADTRPRLIIRFILRGKNILNSYFYFKFIVLILS